MKLRRIRWRLLHLDELRHGNIVAKMSLEQFVCDKSLWRISLCIYKGNVVVDFTDPLQLVCMAMVVRASVDTNQKDGHMNPREPE